MLLPALCAVAIAAGVGLPIVRAAIRARTSSALTVKLTVATLAALLLVRMSVMRERTTDRVELSSRPDACAPDIGNIDPAFTRRTWHQYGMTQPGCEEQ